MPKFEFELNYDEAQVLFSALNQYTAKLMMDIQDHLRECSNQSNNILSYKKIEWCINHKIFFDEIRVKMGMDTGSVSTEQNRKILTMFDELSKNNQKE